MEGNDEETLQESTWKVRLLLEEVVNKAPLVDLEGFSSISWSFWSVRTEEMA